MTDELLGDERARSCGFIIEFVEFFAGNFLFNSEDFRPQPRSIPDELNCLLILIQLVQRPVRVGDRTKHFYLAQRNALLLPVIQL